MPPQQPPSRPILYWVIIFILLLYAIPVTFFAVKSFLNSQGSQSIVTSSDLNPVKSDSFFNSQVATVDGKITKVNGRTISVINSNNQTANLELSDNLTITDIQNPIATPSADLKRIQLNRSALVALNLVDNKYKVTTITYKIPTPNISNNTSRNQQSSTASGIISPLVIPELPKPPAPVVNKPLPKP